MSRVAIVTSSYSAPGAVAFKKAFLNRGHDATVCLISDDNIESTIKESDYVVPRIKPAMYREFLRVNESLKDEKLANILNAFDKITAYQRMFDDDIPMPTTEIIHTDEALAGLKPPVVLKVPCGNQGKGVELAHTADEYHKIRDDLLGANDEIIAQEFIKESKGSDIRIIIAAGEFIAAMRRQSGGNDFRANLHLGGRAYAYSPTKEEIEIAIRAVGSLGIDFAGVDILHSNRGPLALEVNPSPGFGISEVVGYDVPSRIVEQLEKKGKIK